MGLGRNATQGEVKRSFRKLAMKLHPDQAEGDKKEAERKFKEINEAYSVLSDPNKRAHYDRFGKALSFSRQTHHSNMTYTTFSGKSKRNIILEKLELEKVIDLPNLASELNVRLSNLIKIIQTMIHKNMINGIIKENLYYPMRND